MLDNSKNPPLLGVDTTQFILEKNKVILGGRQQKTLATQRSPKLKFFPGKFKLSNYHLLSRSGQISELGKTALFKNWSLMNPSYQAASHCFSMRQEYPLFLPIQIPSTCILWPQQGKPLLLGAAFWWRLGLCGRETLFLCYYCIQSEDRNPHTQMKFALKYYTYSHPKQSMWLYVLDALKEMHSVFDFGDHSDY